MVELKIKTQIHPKIKRSILICVKQMLLFALITLPAFGTTDFGAPFIQHFSPIEMNAHQQNWAVTVTDNGTVVVANQGGVSLYDGARWQTLSQANFWDVHSMAASDHRIYVGMQNDFGYFEKLTRMRTPVIEGDAIPQSDWRYFSLVKQFKLSGVDKLYSVAETPQGVFFVDSNNLYRYHQENLKTIPLHRTFSVGRLKWLKGKLYVLGYWSKVWHYDFNNDTLVLIADDPVMEKSFIRDVLVLDDKHVVLATYDRGLFKLDDNGKVSRFETEVDTWLRQGQIWEAIASPEPIGKSQQKAIILASQGSGVMIIDASGQLIRALTTEDGLEYNSVKGLAFDRDNGLWLAQDGGTSRVDLLSPVTSFAGTRGVQGVEALKTFRGRLIAGSRLSGIHIYEPSTSHLGSGRFRVLDPKYKAVWDFAVVDDGIIVGDRRGMDWLKLNESFQVEARVPVTGSRGFAFASTSPNQIYVTRIDGLFRLDKINGQWTSSLYNDSSFRRLMTYLVVDPDGSLWAGGINDKVARISQLEAWPNIKVEWLSQAHGLPKGTVNVFRIDDRVYFSSWKGLFVWSKESQRFETVFKNAGFGFMRSLIKHGDRWWTVNKNQVMHFQPGNSEQSKLYLAELPGVDKVDLNKLLSRNDKLLWLAKLDGLYRIETDKIINSAGEKPPLPLQLNRLTEHTADVSYITNQFTKPISISPDHTKITVSFASPSYQNIQDNRYRYRLNEGAWSELTQATNWQTNFLPYGQHKLDIQASDGATLSAIATVQMDVLKPWYLSGAMLALYSLIAGTLLFIFSRFYIHYKTRKLERQAAILQNKVEASTATISAQKNRLEQLDKYKTQFFANITHELRTPLTVALGTLELLKKKHQYDEDELRFLDAIETNNQRLLTLVNQILEANRLQDTDEQQLVGGSVFDLVKLAQNSVQAFLGLAEKEALRLAFTSEAPKALVFVNPDQLEQIISNLIINALNFTPAQGAIDVVVAVKNKEVCLSVSDTGPGIADKDKPYVFDRFFSHKNLTKYSFQQTGIGLSVVKSLVEIHQGRIEVVDNEPNGTRFHLYFPEAQGPEDEHQKTYHSEVKNSPVVSMLEGTTEITASTPVTEDEIISEDDARRKILVIDDNPEIGVLLAEIFEPEYRLICTYDGEAGIEKAKSELPDLIICDLRMPKMDGMEVTKAIKMDIDLATIPLIMLTASHSQDDELKSLQLEANDFISKPFSTAKLYQKVVNQIALQTRWREQFAKNSNPEQSDGNDRLDRSGEEIPSESQDAWLKLLKTRLEDNLSEVKSISSLASLVHMDRSSLYRKLQASIGQSPQEFLKSFRLEAAEQAIINSDNTITAIASHCGFSNLSSFSRAFKEKFGMSPNQYRLNEKS